MTGPREPLRFLSPEEMDALHLRAVRILAEVGMRIDHDRALDHLAGVGCRVDRDRRSVAFPEEVTLAALERLRRDFAARGSPEGMAVRYSRVGFRSEPFRIHPDFTVSAGGYCRYIYDLEGVRRPATLADTRAALRLAEALPNIAFTGLPVAAQDVPQPVRQIRMAAELAKHTRKLGGIEALSPFDVEYICRIGEVVRGGPRALREKPILVGYAEARSPLTVDRNMAEVMLAYLDHGLPQSLDTMPNGGATAPIQPAGILAVGLAETLAGLVLAYAVDERAVVTLDVTPSFADPSTGNYRYAGAERASLLGARVQMVSEYYGCPSGIHGGKTDACVFDVRCGVEKAATMLFPVLCGAIGVGTVGHLENALTFSPAQLVMDDEIASYVRRSIRGFEVNDATVDIDLIRRIGPGGSYFDDPSTAAGFRDAMHLSPFFRAEPWGLPVGAEESRRWESAARERAAALAAREPEPPLRPEQILEIDEIVREAEAAVRQKGLL